MKTLPFLLLAAALPVYAQVHKCTVDDKVTYSEHPCVGGTGAVLPPPHTPPADPDAAANLARMQKQSQQLQKERAMRDAVQAREDVRQDRLAATRRQKCNKLKLDTQWAAEDARRAAPQAAEAARLKARRASERYGVECG